MTTLPAVEQVPKDPQAHKCAPAALRRLTSRERQRIADRLAELDSLERLARERPYTGAGWAA